MKKNIILIIVVVLAGVGLGYLEFRKTSNQLVPPAIAGIKGECLGDNHSYFEGPQAKDIPALIKNLQDIGMIFSNRERSKPRLEGVDPDRDALKAFYKFLSEHPIVCNIGDRYALVYRMPVQDENFLFKSFGVNQTFKVYLRDQRKQDGEVLIEENGPYAFNTATQLTSGGIDAIFYELWPEVLDISVSGGSDWGSFSNHRIIDLQSRRTLAQYSLFSGYGNGILIKKDGKEWNIEVSSREEDIGNKAAGDTTDIKINGVSVNGVIAEPLGIAKKVIILESPLDNKKRGSWGSLFGDLALQKSDSGRHPAGGLRFSKDFSKAFFNLKLYFDKDYQPSDPSTYDYEDSIDLGQIEIELK